MPDPGLHVRAAATESPSPVLADEPRAYRREWPTNRRGRLELDLSALAVLAEIGLAGCGKLRTTSMGDDALNQAQEEGQVAKAVADDTRPRTFCPLSDRRKCETCDCHPDRVPESRLHEKVESRPPDTMDN